MQLAYRSLGLTFLLELQGKSDLSVLVWLGPIAGKGGFHKANGDCIFKAMHVHRSLLAELSAY